MCVVKGCGRVCKGVSVWSVSVIHGNEVYNRPMLHNCKDERGETCAGSRGAEECVRRSAYGV